MMVGQGAELGGPGRTRAAEGGQLVTSRPWCWGGGRVSRGPSLPVTLPFPRWEQPGQAALSEELCQGLSLPQWRLRWVQAQGALQQLCR